MTIKELRDRLFENWPAKVVCLALALLLFLFYRMSTLERKFFSVPLAVETNGDIVPAAQYPKTVKVGIRGEVDRIYPVQEGDIYVYVDLTEYTKEGEYSVPVLSRLNGSAQDIDALEIEIEPREITLRVEHRVIKRLAVNPAFKGYPEAGFEMTGYILNPQTIEVSGPRGIMEKFNELSTEPIDLAGRNAAFEGSVPLVNRNSLVTAGNNGKIEYRVAIAQTTLIRTFDDVPFFFENLNPSLSVETDAVSGTLSVKGGQTELSGWVLPPNALTVLCENVTGPGAYSLPVQAIVPETMEIVSFDPGVVQMTVTRRTP